MCPFDYTAFAVSEKVRTPLTELATPIQCMLSVNISIDRPKSELQLLCNQTLHFPKYLNYTLMQWVFFLSSNAVITRNCNVYSLYIYVLSLDYTTAVVSGRIGIPLPGLTTLVGWLSLPN